MQLPPDAKLRVGDVARLIGRSSDTVRRLVDNGLLEAELTEGGQRLVTAGSVEAYLAWRDRKEEVA